MIVPEYWLRSFCDPALDAESLAHALTMAGLEVESCAPVAPAFSGVVAAQVIAVERHPGADKLTRCTVDSGQGKVQVVCGAPNVRAGMKVPFAQVGAKLPGGLEIALAKVRGVESRGMLCSARELGLSEDHGGLLEIAGDTPVGTDIRSALELDERVFDIKLTPNRADCLSVLGVAREVAALTRAPLAAPPFAPVAARIEERLPVRIVAPDLCGRFSGRIVRGVNARAETPAWMKRRLERAGQRPISALVDISNYVMLELGRPSHIFDRDKVAGGLEVRWGRAGETAELLNGQTVAVDGSVGVIADDRGVEALAGIMGGEPTAVTLDTRAIYIEAAFWWPQAVAGRSRRFGFTTDAGHRFERGVDFATTVEHIEYITRLVLEICGGEPGPIDDTVARLPERNPVRMRIARAQKVIGMPIAAEEMADVFARLALPVRREGDAFVVIPPPHRFDLEIEEDLIEEVARVHGFENIPAHPPLAAAKMHSPAETRRSQHALRECLAACDYHETINFAFVEPDWESDLAANPEPIRLLNPIASQLSVMRSTLVGSLLANVRYNHARKLPRVRVFEIGRCYRRDASVADGDLSVAGVAQPLRIAGAAFGPALDEQWGAALRAVDFYDLKADVETLCFPRRPRFEAAAHPALHPGRSARVLFDGAAIGWVGELHPRWQRKYELSQPVQLFELDAEAVMTVPLPQPSEPSRYPVVVRDIAMTVDVGTTAQQLLDAANAAKPGIVQDVRLFDLYLGPNLQKGRKSLAFRVVMQDTERTLTDAEADAARDALVELWGRRFGASLRG
ncbi:MAG: phenylalanine--tRNA ligase subunit beta [Betaproteobacteria bacterium RIFCSPLOWO2_02_FULL_66_14]|nr:MAG: phenylalanine--tRNA ligase subunit beta [Betaproteobacteria bacterium RIFCSPLOWO2_02_FULL_66_14]